MTRRNIYGLFVCGSRVDDDVRNPVKSKSSSRKSKLKKLWGKAVFKGNDEEVCYLLTPSTSKQSLVNFVKTKNLESSKKSINGVNCPVKKKKGLMNKFGKFALQTCRYIGIGVGTLGGVGGLGAGPHTFGPNYNTGYPYYYDYNNYCDYATYGYPTSQYYSPSVFF